MKIKKHHYILMGVIDNSGAKQILNAEIIVCGNLCNALSLVDFFAMRFSNI
jgi:hypothetical protein